MDVYLDANFSTYLGVPDLIEWCLSHGIFFMINTTGTQGYFQRVFAKGLLPAVPFVTANPLICFLGAGEDPRYLYWVTEIDDKPNNTESLIRCLGISPRRVVIIGDCGGDGPHFEWGSSIGPFLISGMVKPSLDIYCRDRGVIISKRFGGSYSSDERQDRSEEMQTNFMELTETIEALLF